MASYGNHKISGCLVPKLASSGQQKRQDSDMDVKTNGIKTIARPSQFTSNRSVPSAWFVFKKKQQLSRLHKNYHTMRKQILNKRKTTSSIISWKVYIATLTHECNNDTSWNVKLHSHILVNEQQAFLSYLGHSNIKTHWKKTAQMSRNKCFSLPNRCSTYNQTGRHLGRWCSSKVVCL